VIHAVGPVWGDGDEDVKLAAAVRGNLKVADELKLTSLAMPAISTGIFGFPIERAAHIILNTIREYYARYPNSGLKLVRLILYGENSTRVFVDGLDNISHEGTDK
jgi:O-acetyl-ADP-ribose deacetylase (regulator of RNase III)